MKKKVVIIGLIIFNIMFFCACDTLNTSIIRRDKFKVAYLNEKEVLDEVILEKLKSNDTINLNILEVESNSGDEEAFKKDFVKLVKNNDLIIVSGRKFQNVINDIASIYRNKKFIVFSGEIKESNVQNITFNFDEGGFLAGVLSGAFTKNNIGFIGFENKEGRGNENLIYGFIAGIKTLNENAANKLLKDENMKIINKNVSEAEYKDLAYKEAIKFYENGCDIILVDSINLTDEVLKAAKEKNKYVINMGNKLEDQNVLGSIIVKVYDVLDESIIQLNEGKFKSGSNNIINKGIKDDIVNIYINENIVNKENIEKVNYYRERILNDNLYIPKIKEELYEFS